MNLLRDNFDADDGDETVRSLTPDQIVEGQMVALATNAVAMTQIIETAKTLIGANLDHLSSLPLDEDWIEMMTSMTCLLKAMRGIAPVLSNLNNLGSLVKIEEKEL